MPDVRAVDPERAKALRREREVERPGHGEERHGPDRSLSAAAYAGAMRRGRGPPQPGRARRRSSVLDDRSTRSCQSFTFCDVWAQRVVASEPGDAIGRVLATCRVLVVRALDNWIFAIRCMTVCRRASSGAPRPSTAKSRQRWRRRSSSLTRSACAKRTRRAGCGAADLDPEPGLPRALLLLVRRGTGAAAGRRSGGAAVGERGRDGREREDGEMQVR